MPSRSRLPRRAGPPLAGAALALGTIVLAPAAGATDTPPPPPPAAGTLEDLGVAMRAPNVRLSDVDVLADGTPVAYVFSDGEPVSFNVVDLRSGTVLDSHAMPPYSVASAIDVAADDTVYLSVRSPNDGTLWSYDPATSELTTVATGVAGEQMLRTLDVDGTTLYGTTYPNAELYALDLTSGELTEYGRIAAQGDYAWGLEADGGNVWVGAGTPAQLYDVDPADGTVAELPLPGPVAEGAEFIQRIETHGDLKVVSHRTVDGVNVTVTDAAATAVDQLYVGGLWNSTEASADGRFYYLDADSRPHAYDIAARTDSPVQLAPDVEAALAGTSRLFLVELGTEQLPGHTLVGMRTDGRIWRQNLATGHGDVLAAPAIGSPVTTMSIGEGGDGQVYVGAYLSPGVMARVDPTTGEVEQLDGPEQADAITRHEDLTVIGSYPEAVFHAARAGEPWAWGTNPAHVLTLGRAASGQDRPRSLVSAGDVVAAGTIANYGELGGALTLFDPVTGEHTMHRDVVEDQSVTALAYADGVVYAGTSVHGGLSSVPTQSTAEVFAWDVETDSLVASGPVVDGATVVHALVVDGVGRLFGMTDNGVLFEYDTDTHEVVRSVQTGIRNANIWGDQSEMGYNPLDGQIYASVADRLVRIDPADLSVETVLTDGARNSTVAHGDVWLTDETNVLRYDLPGACDDTVTGRHDGPLRVTAGTTCLDGAHVTGPLTVAPGASLVVEGSVVDGPLRTSGAQSVAVRGTEVGGPVEVVGTLGRVALADLTVAGPLVCRDNAYDPTDEGAPNAVAGPSRGQCAS
ncbi:NHL repeat-containing protein [Georgenia subflava]|uniref:PQQ-binding-like beta-propeller repeat protein n=1 Tax=Georgenia subflava TaxID=1622177 RepID=A0A6N7EHK6_9MICO|nr:hypothetical protein [Georgenia subflava]MPV36468.1 hypothetical protein [Georgenia subflava]